MAKITYPDKNTGDSFSGEEATEIKTVVNANADTTTEEIFFEALDEAYVTRGVDFKVSTKTDFGGISTIVTSADAAYTLNTTVSAGDYLKVTADTINTRTVLTIQAV